MYQTLTQHNQKRYKVISECEFAFSTAHFHVFFLISIVNNKEMVFHLLGANANAMKTAFAWRTDATKSNDLILSIYYPIYERSSEPSLTDWSNPGFITSVNDQKDEPFLLDVNPEFIEGV